MKLTSSLFFAGAFLLTTAGPSEQQMVVRRFGHTPVMLDHSYALARRQTPPLEESDDCVEYVHDITNGNTQDTSLTTTGNQQQLGGGGGGPPQNTTDPNKKDGKDTQTTNPEDVNKATSLQSKDKGKHGGTAGKENQGDTVGGKQVSPGNVPDYLAFGKTHSGGDATTWGKQGMSGACGMDQLMIDGMKFLAMGKSSWGPNGESCGGCVLASVEGGTPTKVMVTNECPECGEGLDFEQGAWDAVTNGAGAGRMPVTWEWTECGVKNTVMMKDLGYGQKDDFRINFALQSGAILLAEVGTMDGSDWLALIKSQSNGYTPNVEGTKYNAQSASNAIKTGTKDPKSPDYIKVRLTNLKGEQIQQDHAVLLPDYEDLKIQFSTT